MCMDLCARPVTVSESICGVSCTTNLNRQAHIVFLLLAGSMPAQLLSRMFEKVGGPGQKDLSNLPTLIPTKICSQSSHQHCAYNSH